MENDNSIKNNKAAGDCDRLPYILIKSHSFLKNHRNHILNIHLDAPYATRIETGTGRQPSKHAPNHASCAQGEARTMYNGVITAVVPID